MTHEEEVEFIMGEVGGRALRPLPLARDVRPVALGRLEIADAHSHRHDFAGGGRVGSVRRALAHLVAEQLDRQATFNREAALAIRDVETLTTILEERLRLGWINLDHRLGRAETESGRIEGLHSEGGRRSAAVLAGLDVRVNELEGELGEVGHRWAGVLTALDGLRGELEQQRAENARLRVQVNGLAALVAPQLAGSAQAVGNAESERETASFMDGVYVEFEDVFRGSREHVRQRQEPYMREVEHLRGGIAPVVDIGPGRCEWLELLGAEGIPAYGCDLNEGMVEFGQSVGVDVRGGNGIGHLRATPANSLGAVSAFQVVEHLVLDDIVALLDGALSALQPGGVLILETPNPGNLVIGAYKFWVDPTHIRPLPPELLEFLTRSRGFADVQRRFLNPLRDDWSPAEGDPIDPIREEISWRFFGPQDYAIVARKPRAEEAV